MNYFLSYLIGISPSIFIIMEGSVATKVTTFCSFYFVVWIYARFTKDSSSLVGSGTRFIVRESNPTPVSTKWITCFYFPLLPVRSYHMMRRKGQHVDYFEMVPFRGVGLSFRAIAATYLSGTGIVVALLMYGTAVTFLISRLPGDVSGWTVAAVVVAVNIVAILVFTLIKDSLKGE